MLGHGSYKGYWGLICDGESAPPTCPSGFKTMSESLKKLQRKKTELFPIPPKAVKFKENDSLLIFTSDDSEEGVQMSAEAIRSNIDYPFIMYYFKKRDNDTKGRSMLYKHNPNNELYKCNSVGSSVMFVWKLISKKTKLTTFVEELLPSQVTDRDHIHLPANEEEFLEAMKVKGGKWMLQCSDWKTLDNLWKSLIRLYDTGVLVGLKSCTAKFSIKKFNPIYETKAIMCYTADADCKSSVKRAAECIFICTGYIIPMYYKSNEASQEGKYRHEGFIGVAKYLYETSEMYERDYLNRWKKCF